MSDAIVATLITLYSGTIGIIIKYIYIKADNAEKVSKSMPEIIEKNKKLTEKVRKALKNEYRQNILTKRLQEEVAEIKELLVENNDLLTSLLSDKN